METLSNSLVPQERKTFDFENNKVEVFSLETLKRTHKENDTIGNPLKGMYHYELIEKTAELCREFNLDYQIEEIFAAQNKSKSTPGVVILPQVERIYGEKAVEAHIVRRIYTTIKIHNLETDELSTTIALAWHQDGIQVGIGPNVKVCRNQCILSSDRLVSTYGKEKLTNEQILETIREWLSDFENNRREDLETISLLKSINLPDQELIKFIGLLSTIRVCHDSDKKELSEGIEDYPLNQSQITQFIESTFLKKLDLEEENKTITCWDIYNVATKILKPGKVEIPTILPQIGLFVSVMRKFISDNNLK